MSDFHDTLLKGNIFKEIVKVLLEKSDYTVIPYGYENSFSNIRKALSEKQKHDSETARRIRSSPDLLVFDEETKDVRLVEVKMSSYAFPQLNKKGQIETYKKFWNDAIMVLVTPHGNVFFAQRIDDLGKKNNTIPKQTSKKSKKCSAKSDQTILNDMER